MYPIDTYTLARMRQEEMLRQAQHARLLRAARLRSHSNWLGTHLVKWGQKLEQFGTRKESQPLPSVPRQH